MKYFENVMILRSKRTCQTFHLDRDVDTIVDQETRTGILGITVKCAFHDYQGASM